MERLLECVPNFSEGQDVPTLDAIASAFGGHPDTWLLDRTSDQDHGRSVYTLVGHPSRVLAAMTDAVGMAIETIDMRSQDGQHPRIGSVDVIPFIPVAGMTMEDCVRDAREFAADIAERFALPVYLYAMAARREDRRVLAGIRRPGIEGLSAAMLDPGGAPDLGPRRPHPSAGAVSVGARRSLIAFNVQLGTADVAPARRLARRIRERDGGLPAVQALGLELASLGQAQLSMNILDHERTPLWRVWEEAQRLAAAEDVPVLDAELIGLAPLAALLDVADHLGVSPSDSVEDRLAQAGSWLRIRDFEPSMALELRLARIRAV
jgi:glutamate formiminotransferase